MGIVGFIGMGQDAIGQSGGNGVGYQGGTDDLGLRRSTLHLGIFDGQPAWLQRRSGNHRADGVQNMVFGL